MLRNAPPALGPLPSVAAGAEEIGNVHFQCSGNRSQRFQPRVAYWIIFEAPDGVGRDPDLPGEPFLSESQFQALPSNSDTLRRWFTIRCHLATNQLISSYRNSPALRLHL
jgi:hypothetical protein